MGIEEDKIDSIIEAHTETVDALKKERDGYKVDAEQLVEVRKQLDDAKNVDSFKDKYDTLKKEFEDYKQAEANKATKLAKTEAYKALLKEIGISDKRIDSVVRVSDIDAIELIDGKINKANELKSSLKEEWSDFIVKQQEQGADTVVPPSGGQGGNDFSNMSLADKMTYANAHPDSQEVIDWLKS